MAFYTREPKPRKCSVDGCDRPRRVAGAGSYWIESELCREHDEQRERSETEAVAEEQLLKRTTRREQLELLIATDNYPIYLKKLGFTPDICTSCAGGMSSLRINGNALSARDQVLRTLPGTHGYYFYGLEGRGKTAMIARTIHALLSGFDDIHPSQVNMIVHRQFLDSLNAAAYEDKDRAYSVPVLNCCVLAITEFCQATPRDAGFAIETSRRLIDDCMRSGVILLIDSNRSIDDLQRWERGQTAGGASPLSSRIAGNLTVINLTGSDMRLTRRT